MADPTSERLGRLGLLDWPRETRLTGEMAHRRRRPRELSEFEDERLDITTRLQGEAGLAMTRESLIAARLYTGPAFVKYNAVLRGMQCGACAFFVQRLEGLCGSPPNLYATTLHVINNAIVALARLTAPRHVYRGIAGGKLPDAFHIPDQFGNVGGVELGCMSTTDDLSVALEYAADDNGLVLEIHLGESRGAELMWVSQYPHEQESASPQGCRIPDADWHCT